MKKQIITISREYGSGGRQVGLLTAERLGMKFYDKALIEAASREIGFPEDMIADHDQKLTNSLLYNFALGTLRGATFLRTGKQIPSSDRTGFPGTETND